MHALFMNLAYAQFSQIIQEGIHHFSWPSELQKAAAISQQGSARWQLWKIDEVGKHRCLESPARLLENFQWRSRATEECQESLQDHSQAASRATKP